MNAGRTSWIDTPNTSTIHHFWVVWDPETPKAQHIFPRREHAKFSSALLTLEIRRKHWPKRRMIQLKKRWLSASTSDPCFKGTGLKLSTILIKLYCYSRIFKFSKVYSSIKLSTTVGYLTILFLLHWLQNLATSKHARQLQPTSALHENDINKSATSGENELRFFIHQLSFTWIIHGHPCGGSPQGAVTVRHGAHPPCLRPHRQLPRP